jgi:hypothetical protein
VTGTISIVKPTPPDESFFVNAENLWNVKPLSPNLKEGNSIPISYFVIALNVPPSFTEGILRMQGEVEIKNPVGPDWSAYKVGVQSSVRVAPHPEPLQTPIQRSPEDVTYPEAFSGLYGSYWYWGNGPGVRLGVYGPGVPHFSIHSTPIQRYSYDLKLLKYDHPVPHGYEDMIKGYVTHYWNSDILNNKRYFCFDRPILAMHDGYVVEVIENYEDNKGILGWNEENPDRINNVIVIEHRDGKRRLKRFSTYYHLQQNSVTIVNGKKLGPDDPVKAGDELARIGNVGVSTEPHLHVGYYEIDPSGRARSLPLRFVNLEAFSEFCFDAGSIMCMTFPMTLVPIGGSKYNPIT